MLGSANFCAGGMLTTIGTKSDTPNDQGSEQTQKSEGGGGLSIGAWVGIAASILSAIAAVVSIWYKCCRNQVGRRNKEDVWNLVR